MAYPDDGDPIQAQYLEALRANMQAISQPTYHHDVKVAKVYEGRQISAGTYYPVIIIVPESDDQSGILSCQRVIHDAEVSLYGAIRYQVGSEAWKDQLMWLAADMRVAITNDPQLGGLVVYIDVNDTEIFDAANDAVAVCRVALRIQYRTVYDNPTLTA